MPTTSATPIDTGDATVVEEQFLALIYADEQLVRAEFDALIAAVWDQPGPNPPRRPAQPRPTRWPRRGRQSTDGCRCPVEAVGLTTSARQRSPPESADKIHELQRCRRG